MGLEQVLAVGAVALEQIGNGVEAEPVEAEVEPEADHVEHGLLDLGVVEVEVRLVAEEPVPEVLLAHGSHDQLDRSVSTKMMRASG